MTSPERAPGGEPQQATIDDAWLRTQIEENDKLAAWAVRDGDDDEALGYHHHALRYARLLARLSQGALDSRRLDGHSQIREAIKALSAVCGSETEHAGDYAKARERLMTEIDAYTGQQVARLTSAIRWALGEEGDFRGRDSRLVVRHGGSDFPTPAEGPYYWRTELRERAGLAARSSGGDATPKGDK